METSRSEIAIEPEISELVPSFRAARNKDITTMTAHLSASDFTSISNICHTIKGVARPYGFPTLETLSRQLETAAKASDPALCAQLLSQIREYMQHYSH